MDFFEFVNLMVKRENEKETEDDLKQVFRVFDKENRVLFESLKLNLKLKCRMVTDTFQRRRSSLC